MRGKTMTDYLVRECGAHGVTTAQDEATATMAQVVARDCVEWSTQDARQHALEHRAEGTDCYVCCSDMRVAAPGEVATAWPCCGVALVDYCQC
jgi:hypothetical protein